MGGRSVTGYDAWAASITQRPDENHRASGDGYPNLLKYATGSSPTNSDTLAAMNGQLTSGLFALGFNRNTNASDVTLIVEGANSVSNNAAWNGMATNVNGSWGGATNVAEVGTTNPLAVTVQDVSAGTNHFLRLRVTRP